MKRVKRLDCYGGMAKRFLFSATTALFLFGCSSAPTSEQFPISDTEKQLPKGSQILEVEKGDRVHLILNGETNDWLSCDEKGQEALSYGYLGDRTIFLHCARARLGNTYATPQYFRYAKRARTAVSDFVAIVPPETVASKIHITVLPIPAKLSPAGYYLTLNGKRLIIQPDENWSEKGKCEASLRLLVGERNNASLCADAIFTEEPQPATGSVILSHWKSNLTCTLAVPTGRMARRHYHFLDWESGDENHDKPWGPCTANTTHSIQLESVPSAARILLTDDPGCDKDAEGNEFWIELRTTAKSVTLNAIPLDEILTYQPEAIVRPGLQLVGSYLMHGKSAQRNLGCAKVTTSAAPPAP